MFQIDCPYCGPRDQIEFSWAGEADIRRPTNASEMSDEEWADYLFFRKNTCGIYREQWVHAHGCQQFFVATRNTITNEIESTEKMGASAASGSES